MPEDELRKLFAVVRNENRLLFYNELVDRGERYGLALRLRFMNGLRTFLICGLFLATTGSGNSLILTASCTNGDFEQLVARLIGH